MAATTVDAPTTPARQEIADHGVSLFRLYVLRATYLLLVIGLGATIVPDIISHPVPNRGVIPSLLCAIWALAFLGLRYPLQMLPLLLFEFAWKSIWTVAYAVPQWSAGQLPPTFADDSFSIGLGVVLAAGHSVGPCLPPLHRTAGCAVALTAAGVCPEQQTTRYMKPPRPSSSERTNARVCADA